VNQDVDDSEDESDDESGILSKNTNKSDVQALAKEKREQARMDSAAKKQKDKDDREKQKQLREEKKEKRKPFIKPPTEENHETSKPFTFSSQSNNNFLSSIYLTTLISDTK